MRIHIQIIAWIHLIIGGFAALCGVLLLLAFMGIGTVAAVGGGPGGLLGFSVLGGIGTFLMIFAACMALPDLLIGWGLLQGRDWARILCLVISVLHMISGVGLVLGVYSLVVLLSADGARQFS